MWVFPEIRTLGDIPRYHARRRPDAPAVVSGGRTTSFSALDRESNAVANALLAGAFGKDARIGFLGKNSPYLASALFGTAKAGLTFLPLNCGLSVARTPAVDQ